MKTSLTIASWAPSFARQHALVIVPMLVAFCLGSIWLAGLEIGIQLGIVALLVTIGGLPHGALDLALLRGMGARRDGLVLLIGFYLLIAGLVLAAFAWQPVVALMVFLAVAWWHFGLGDTEDLAGWARGLEGLARGGFSIAGPIWFHPEATFGLFRSLCGPESDGLLLILMNWFNRWVAVPWFGLVALAIGRRLFLAFREKKSVSSELGHLLPAAEIGATLWFFAGCPPLIAFAVYFTAIHSVRHLAGLAAARFPDNQPRAWRWLVAESWPLTVLTVFLAGITTWGFRKYLASDVLVLRVVFIGLAALTMPHMALTCWWQKCGEPAPIDLFSRSSRISMD